MFQVQNRGPPISTTEFEDVVASVKLTSEKFWPLWSTPLASRGGGVLGLKSAVTCNTNLQRLYGAQGVTTYWKSVHRISGYQLDIRGIIYGYQEKIHQIGTKYLTDFGRIL